MAGGSGKVDHSLDKPKLLTCLTRSVRSGANKWASHSPGGEQRQPATKPRARTIGSGAHDPPKCERLGGKIMRY